MIDFLQIVFTVLLLIAAGLFAWGSTVLVNEKKERQRKGLTDYYDNPIKKDKNARIS